MTVKFGQKSKVLAELGQTSLLGVVPGLDDLVLSRGEVRLVSPRDPVFSQGAQITHCAIPLSDDLRLFVKDGAGAARPLGLLQRRRALALGSLLAGQPYPYTAVPTVPTTVLFVPRAEFLALVERHPSLAHYLKLMTSSPGARGLHRYLVEEGLEHEQVLEVFERIPLARYTLAARQHYAPAEHRLVLIDSGQLLYSGVDGGAPYSGVLGERAFFGGEALVPPSRLSYAVLAVGPASFHAARLTDLEQVLKRHDLVDRLYDEPCITRAGKRRGQVTQAAVPLPGRVLALDQVLALGLPAIDPEQFTFARTDGQSAWASISNLATLLGVPVNQASLKNDLAAARRLTPLKLAEAIEPYGLITKALESDPGLLPGHRLPSLVHLQQRLCVLLLVEGRRGIRYVLDPAYGVVAMSPAEFGQAWDGQVLEVAAASVVRAEAPLPPGTPGAPAPAGDIKAEMRGLLGQFKKPLINVLLLSLATFGLVVLMPMFSQAILDQVLTLRDTTTLWTCVVGMLLATGFMVAFSVLKVLVTSEFSYRYDFLLSTRFYRHVLALPSRMFAQSRAGGVIARLGEIWVVREFLSSSSIESIVQLFSVFIFIGVLFFYSWKVALVPLVGVPLMVALQYAYKSRLARNYEAAFEAQSRSKSLLAEQISAVMTVKALGMEKIARTRWEEAYLGSLVAQRRAQLALTSIGGLTGFLSRGTSVVGLWVAAYLALKGELSPGALLAVTMYLDNLVSPAAGLADVFSRFEQVKVAVRKLGELSEAPTEVAAGAAQTTYSFPLKGKIRFERVSFRYGDSGPWVLRDVSFTIYPRQVVAIVGKSGCGKSTIANLIAGNLRPTSGRIFYDEYDGAFVSLPSLRRQVGFIMQSRDLYSGTIRENIAFADDGPVDSEVEEAARQASALEFIRASPSGFDHWLGEGGLGLSGGQMQRLTIARTLYRQPSLLIMDEATSALDAASERAVLTNLRALLAGKTTIIIAHRVTTIRGADNILVFRDGELVEQGQHADLLQANGLYQELFESRSDSPEA